jgi:hypothetical protein
MAPVAAGKLDSRCAHPAANRVGGLPTPAPYSEQSVEAQGPATPAASGTRAPSPQCNVPVCWQFFRSFHASDGTYSHSIARGKFVIGIELRMQPKRKDEQVEKFNSRSLILTEPLSLK